MLEKVKRIFARDCSRVKVPTILQMEATECGAAALAMVLAHYGLWIPLEKLRAECGVNRDGSKASCVIRAARNRKCQADGYRWSTDDLLELLPENPFPLIIHWEFNHFVVLEGIKNGKAYLNDPAMGRRTVPLEEFRTSYTGVSLYIEPGEDFVKAGHRYNVFKDLGKKLMEDHWAALFILILEFCAIIPGLAGPVMSQIFLDEILTRKHLNWMTSFCMAMTASFILSGIMTWLRAVVLTQWQRKLTLADSSSYFWHLLKLPMQFFHQRYAAEVAGRVGFNESIAGVLSGPAATAVLDFFVALFYLLLLLQYNVTLTIIGVLFSSVEIVLFLAMRRHLTDLNMRIQQDAGKAYGVAMNGLRMIETIKANGDESDFFTKWAGYQTKVLTASQETALWAMSVKMLPTLLSGINGALIMTIGGFSIMEGAMTAGMFMAFQHLMRSFEAPVNALVGLGSTLQTTEMQMQRLNDVRCYEVDSLNFPADEEEKSKKFPMDRLSGEVTLDDVSFGYSPLEPPLLEHFNLHASPGDWIAVVGASGSGKSTFAKIITGLYEEWSGTLAFDGTPRRQVPRQVITSSLAAVDQDIFLITGTVAENIALFDSTVRKSDIIAAAKDACIHEDILQLDGGYEAQVAEGGVNFSGGQRQRLEIARALAVNPSILVLDEATSALDPITEKKVLENIRHRGCTCLIVAHRLSTIRDCDEIIVLSHGKIVERGIHREMVQHDGPYRRLIEEREKEEMETMDE
ncbi:NHLP family bacteriocin export ABC transporter peptidase/permease/ATPase subunit [Selenomonas ruminantium]|uniref:NHLM bacteriocin system ABC transporter, peptidase/ATP-binding protein n=1 Tax=Selenomonas ruminantium TaxID=971 RepID=A0A1H3XE34_SELRU|nr:NHLP family bacteriocin export ABC transporter peptidase/permease/ATPase subunit [Selenomonas ruminantium]SDZ97647.1 NHLM bacteriocin system ABC transporter, peptidase/ATP-binding protein [Selenomonas ruminantium]